MSGKEIIRSWKDEEFRNSLGSAQRALLPGNPAGLIELTDEALDDLIAGAAALDSLLLEQLQQDAVTVVRPR